MRQQAKSESHEQRGGGAIRLMPIVHACRGSFFDNIKKMAKKVQGALPIVGLISRLTSTEGGFDALVRWGSFSMPCRLAGAASNMHACTLKRLIVRQPCCQHGTRLNIARRPTPNTLDLSSTRHQMASRSR